MIHIILRHSLLPGKQSPRINAHGLGALVAAAASPLLLPPARAARRAAAPSPTGYSALTRLCLAGGVTL